jgi:hypothetical protein
MSLERLSQIASIISAIAATVSAIYVFRINKNISIKNDNKVNLTGVAFHGPAILSIGTSTIFESKDNQPI